MALPYEIAQVDPSPRVNSASQEACFLCVSFIRAHGKYYLSRAHRQLYDKWTVPDLKEYDTHARERLQKALAKVNEDVTVARAGSRKPKFWRSYSLQSSINLSKAFVREASMSTILSFISLHNERVSPFEPVQIVTKKRD